ncbi:MAG: anti-sigma factor family protein [Acetobacteraceae bacterium]
MTTLSDTTLLAFVDGELDAAAQEKIAHELADDPAAAETVRLLRSSAALVRAAFAEPGWEAVPERLVALVQGQPARRWLADRRQFGLALAASIAACAAGFAGGIALERSPPEASPPAERLLAEVAEYHAAFAGEASRIAIAPASKAAEIAAWFTHVLGRPVPIPDLRRFGLAFHGARLLMIDERPVTQLLYARPDQASHPLGICITAWPFATLPLRIEHREGLALALWARAGFAYVLVGWTDAARLERIAASLEPVLERT